MEIDIEELVALLYPDGVPETEEFKKYLIYLASCGLDKVLREETHLKEDKNSILEETRDFVYKNYKTFIHSADCSKAIYKQFSDVENNLDRLITSLPDLKSKVDEFLGISKKLSHSRKATLLTLNKHTRLLEILELPQIMETCVRNGYYEDALDILSHVKRLEKKHADVPLIMSIISDVKSGTRLMLLQLLMQLRSSLTLPVCLKTVGYLRRLEVFTDPELRVKFLQTRDSWLSAMVKAVPKDDAFQHISKIIEIYRVHLFDILTQYKAIFSEEEARLNFEDSDIYEQSIFYSWIVHKVTQFITLLKKDLERGVGHNLESLLDQSMFFGQSFSRVGVDFRCLLIPVFQETILKKFVTDVQSANFKFDESLSIFSFVDTIPLQSTSLFMDFQEKTNPPLSLMEFHPIACYANGVLNAFNNLRQCCPVALLKDSLYILSSSLTKIITALMDLYHIESTAFSEQETKSFCRLCQVITHSLIPHFNSCLSYLFPLEIVSKVSGKSIIELQREKIGTLNIEELTVSIKEFLSKNQAIVEVNDYQLTSNKPPPSRMEININDADTSLSKPEEKCPYQKVTSEKNTSNNSTIENKSSNEYLENVKNNNNNNEQIPQLLSVEEKSAHEELHISEELSSIEPLSLNQEVSSSANLKSLSSNEEVLVANEKSLYVNYMPLTTEECDLSSKILNTGLKTLLTSDDQQPLFTNSITEELAPDNGSKIPPSTVITALPSDDSRVVE